MYFRQKVPKNWSADSSSSTPANINLVNKDNHKFGVQVVEPGLIRVVHELPEKYGATKINWENSPNVEVSEKATSASSMKLTTDQLEIGVSWDVTPRVQIWNKKGEKIHTDFPTRSYSFDAGTGAVYHYIEREWYTPVNEDEASSYRKTPKEMIDLPLERNEFIYGLGESRGPLIKNGKRFRMEARDALGFDWEEGDTLYKLSPFYVVYNRRTNSFYGLWYNTLTDSEFDMGVESDVLWGCFRTFVAKSGPLDYYLIYGDGTLPSILSLYSKLVSPSKKSVSPDLPPLNQLGYLASSMSMAEEINAGASIINFVKRSREEGFPIDGLYLSSGWCQNADGDRQFFTWNTVKYPNPKKFVETIEKDLGVVIIANIKPWLLTNHDYYKDADASGAFVKAAEDKTGDEVSPNGSSMSYLWSRGFGEFAPGSYFDFSTAAGNEFWRKCVRESLLENGVTGVWIDNNEFSSLVDDEDLFKGEEPIWDLGSKYGGGEETQRRLGWNGPVSMGKVGRAVQTMGMAKATYQAYKDVFPHTRPVIVSRSGSTGVHAVAHGSWGGDNTSTWQALKYSTKMTLSQGLSLGFGLYGHDIGGFAGVKNPSPELLIRWCQQGSWHTRFTVHSSKKVSTTLWMYPEIKPVLRKILDFRYRFLPTMYSFYVNHYFKNGWSVLKPLLWYHSKDNVTLAVDEQFIVGDKIMVVPVLEKQKTSVEAYLPAIANDTDDRIAWCEIDTGKWHTPSGNGEFVELDAPIDRIPVLARSGAIIVLGGACTETAYDGIGEREATIYAAPGVASKGSFSLIEDDGKTDAHTSQQLYTELELSYVASASHVEVSIDIKHAKYQLPYDTITFKLPEGDNRELIYKNTNGKGKLDVSIRV